MAWSVENRIRLGVVLILGVLLINGLLSYAATNTLINNDQRVRHTYQVINEFEIILSTLKDAETGERGYIITGLDAYLQPYQDALAQIDNHIRTLKELTTDNPAQQDRIPLLQRKVADRIESLKVGISLRQSGEVQGAQQLIASGVGKRMMDDLRQFINGMEVDENELLKRRTDESQKSQRNTILTFIIANLVACTVLLGTGTITLTGINARKRAEDDLRQERQLLQITLSSIADAVIACDTNGSITFLNPVAESLTGWTQQEACGESLLRVFDIVNEQTRQTVDNPALRAIREGTVVGLANHTVLKTKNGTEVPIDDCASPIKTMDGTLVGAVLVFRDITARRRSEQALTQSHERTESILASISDAFYVFDRNWRLTYINDQGVESSRKPREELVGKLLWEVFPDGVGTKLQREYERAMTEHRPVVIEYYYPPFEMWFSHRVYPFSDGVTSYVTDITERRKAEEERARLLSDAESGREKAEAASRSKDEFLAVLSHELRTPLTAVFGWVQLLQDRDVDDVTRTKALEVIDRNIRVQNQLIDDLLNVSQIITGKLQIRREMIDPLEVVNKAIDTARPSADAKGIALQHESDAQVPAISADPARLQQIVWNLLSNAVKFTPKGGRIDVQVRRVRSDLEIAVRDTGLGMSNDFLPLAFNRFSQADASTTRPHGGMGLGLSLVRQLVELHGGKVKAESAGVGKGSVFTVTFPLPGVVERFPAAAIPTADDKIGQALRGVRVLIVEDEPDTREMIAHALQRLGASVAQAASAAEALHEFTKAAPNILISDIGMPDMDGYQLLALIRSQTSSPPPAIALTAYAGSAERERALRSGFQAHLGKPVELSMLISTVGDLVGRAG